MCLQCRRPAFDPQVSKIPWRREWLPIPGLLPVESHGHRSLAGYSPWHCKELDNIKQLTISLSTHHISIRDPRIEWKKGGFFLTNLTSGVKWGVELTLQGSDESLAGGDVIH